jgi:hypothetical protein
MPCTLGLSPRTGQSETKEETLRKLMTALVATGALLAAGAIAGATPITGTGSPLPLTNIHSPVENIACWCGAYQCACGHPYGYHPYAYHPYAYHPYVHPYVRPYRYNY